MDWTQTKVSYYLDFAFVPLLMLAALANDFYHGGNATHFALLFATGFFVWSFLEYWIHRSLLHRALKRAHWLHHKRPGGYVAAPLWITTLAHMFLFGACAVGGALGLCAGIEAGYFLYIWMHDAIHHSPVVSTRSIYGRWLVNRGSLHQVHHHGKEANFGVVTSFWDRVFRTYAPVREGA